jgi:hypothetical protein
VDEGICAAKEYIYVRTDGIGIVIDRELDCAEIELIGLVVEVIEIIDLPISGVARAVGVLAVVAIEISTEIERAQAPHGWARRGRRGVRRCRGWFGGGRLRLGAGGIGAAESTTHQAKKCSANFQERPLRNVTSKQPTDPQTNRPDEEKKSRTAGFPMQFGLTLRHSRCQ